MMVTEDDITKKRYFITNEMMNNINLKRWSFVVDKIFDINFHDIVVFFS